MAFAAFALCPGAVPAPPASQPTGAALPLPPPPPPPSNPWVPDADRDAWAASIYQQLEASPLLSATLDAHLPTVPVILHPSVPRGGEPPPVTARHLGFLRVDLSGETPGPGRFFPLFPADASEAEAGVDTGSLDRFGCTGHWASSGCIRLLTAPSCRSSVAAGGAGGSSDCSSSGGSIDSGSDASRGAMALMKPDAFARLWARSSNGSSANRLVSSSRLASSSSGGSSSSIGGPDSSTLNWPSRGGSAAPPAPSNLPTGWHVPYARLHPLVEAYGGLYRELKAAGHDLSKAHYMLRGWKTKEGRPRQGGSAPRAPSAGTKKAQRKGVVPAEVAATRDLRAMVNWPGLLELLEEEGVESVPTDGVRYWLARMGGDFQARLAAAGILCAETSVHHIIARNNRGIDHPLNYFLIDRGPNSAMGAKVEGFRDANGVKLHMRDIVGERAFEVALAACNLYHGVLWAGRRRGSQLSNTLRELREGAFALADEAIAGRQQQEARREAKGQRGAADAAGAAAAVAVEEGADVDCAAGRSSQSDGGGGEELDGMGDAEPATQPLLSQPATQPQNQPLATQPQSQPPQSLPRSLKRERCSSMEEQQQQQQQAEQQHQQQGPGWHGGSENAPLNGGVLSPSQRQPELRRRRLSGELCLVALYEPGSAMLAEEGAAADAACAAAAVEQEEAAAAVPAPEAADDDDDEEEEVVEAELVAMSLLGSPEAVLEQAGKAEEEEEQQEQQQQRQQSPPLALCLGSLRARLQAALGAGE